MIRTYKATMMLVVGVYLALMLPDMCFGRRDLSRAKGRAQGGWELIWADEFDFFDTNKWEYQYEDGCKLGICHWGNKEKSWYTESNAQIINGKLRIQAREERDEGLARVQQACWDRCGYICAQEWSVGDDHIDQCVKDCGSNRCPIARFTSSRIRTFGKFSISPSNTYKVVRIEAKIKLACQGNGMWPAFWMLPEEGATAGCSGCGKYGQWPASGEIDIMEMFGGSRNPNQINGTLHYGGVGAWSHLTKSTELKQTSDGFHTFAIEWEKDEIRWLADGKEYGRIRRATVTSPGWWTTGSGGSGPFDVNFHILLNLAVGGEYTGNVPADEISRALSSSGQYMEVEYVRVHGRRR